MLSYVAKSSGMSQYFKATATAVAAAKPTLNPSAVVKSSVGTGAHPAPAPRISGDTLRLNAAKGQVLTTSAVRSTASVRCAHTDVRVPDFSDYRRTATKEPTSRNKESLPARQSFTYLISGAGKNIHIIAQSAILLFLIGIKFVIKMNAFYSRWIDWSILCENHRH